MGCGGGVEVCSGVWRCVMRCGGGEGQMLRGITHCGQVRTVKHSSGAYLALLFEYSLWS